MKYDLTKLTIDEKISLLVGANSMTTSDANGKVRPVQMCDGPLGLRTGPKHPATPKTVDPTTGETIPVSPVAMPATNVLANTWDPTLTFSLAAAIADDCLDHQRDLLLAPGVNIKRTPVCGRNFEYFSEDPFLTGTLARAYIQGVQSKGVGTSLKHFCANNAEYDRQAISSEVDERTLREIYLTPFEIALEAKPWTVMCSYNRVGGIYASENPWTLKEILRDEFGFDGIIISDWGATHNATLAAKATLDLTMPYQKEHLDNLRAAYSAGILTEEEINERAQKVLLLSEKAAAPKHSPTTTPKERHEIAVKAAKAGIVLLKNEDGILPLQKNKIFVCGKNALLGAPTGGGSSAVWTTFKPTPLHQLLQEKLGSDAFVSYLPCHDRGAIGSAILNAPAVYKAAYGADVTLLCVGNDGKLEFEGGDREYLRLPKVYEDLIDTTAKYTKNLVVLVYAGSAIDMSAWIDKVKGVVFVGFAGEGANEALAALLTGEANFSGKLSETFPLDLNDTPVGAMKGNNGFVERYLEGVFVGYRHYDEQAKEVLFPFGHGLSYSQFVYSDLTVEKTGKLAYEVSYTVTNLSSVDGEEISEVYVRDVFASVSRPPKELKGYSKDLIKAGESKRIHIPLNARSFAFYSVALKKWTVENGDFEILVGPSSRILPLQTKLKIEDAPHPYSEP
ncbi:MAG: glycoside hydrolase family 3 C-terminal domain-containing protein [Clostridia bacterium]|nr:glycoside hydrolase family 3 C-terminal domain-containing protein [Clostridia bacterium]